MKKITLLFVLLVSFSALAQVGVGTTNPYSQLDVRSSNQAAPANTDGILIPKVDVFPAVVPTVNQQGMLVYLTTTVGTKPPGFYYWDFPTLSWIGLNSSATPDKDWIETGLATAPDDINDSMYHIGDAAIGKNAPGAPLDVQGDDRLAVIQATNVATTTGGFKFGVLSQLTGLTNDLLVGMRSSVSGSGTGSHYGNFNILSGPGDGIRWGTANRLTNAGNGQTVGFYSEMTGNGSGIRYGVLNDISGGTNSIYGIQSSITSTGNGLHYGSQNILSGAGSGTHHGYVAGLSGTGTGLQIGLFNAISNSGNNLHEGVFNSLTGTGSGNHFGVYSSLTGSGTGQQIGSFNVIDNTGNDLHFGVVNQMSGTGTGNHTGISNVFSGAGSGIQYGVQHVSTNTGNGVHYGSSVIESGTGSGIHYGDYVSLSGSGAGNKYGFYSTILNNAGGTHYGIYSDAVKTGSYAGYFLGALSIGTIATNNYILPPSRGTLGQIMQTDAAGIVTWANPNTALNAFNWSTTGNSGLNATTNFLGTTDAIPIIFRTANTEKVRIGVNGTLGIGTTYGTNFANPYSRFDLAGNGINYGDFTMHTAAATDISNWMTFFRSRGTFTVPTAVAQNDEIAVIGAYAHDGTAYNGIGAPNGQTAFITMAMDGPTGTGDMPSRIIFGTTNDGTATATEKMRITNLGNIGINTTTPSVTDRMNTVSGTTMNGMLLTSQRTVAGAYGFRNAATLNGGTANIYTGYSGAIAIAGGTSTNAGVFSDVPNNTTAAIIGSTNGTGTSAAVIGTSTVWNGVNARTSAAGASALIGANTAAAGAGTGSGIYGLTSQLNGPAIYGYNTAGAGTSFGYMSGVSRIASYGNGRVVGSYSFGVLGDGGTSTRSGGVFGDDYGLARGALGYYASNFVDYAVFGFGQNFQAGAAGGKMSASAPNNMIGLGIYGGVMGGWVRGLHYGFHAKGKEYGLYVDGTTITNKPVVQLIDNGTQKRSVAFAPSSMSADIYVRGNARLENGSIFVSFDESFSKIVSAEIPLNITVTPTGPSNGVYVTDVTPAGFRIVENGNGSAGVSVNWVAYGTRLGYENPEAVVSATISSSSFDEDMNAVMYNEKNTDGTQKGIWYDGSKVNIGQTPSSFQAQKLSQQPAHDVPSTLTTNPDAQASTVTATPEAGQTGTSDTPQPKPQSRKKLE
ncbi:MAG: hypothetical protein EOO50_14320 [Flavobacterium sp.]|uniref:beta strand repeat-containing protein n=1 Tax=Flavobacterium sp. TaxID=239 RepID=UPI001220F266|nr:hypothetical protein [Flavobacterium sp.]RZJ65275.1 MAG: hypothetical protein EOO50_14320 [Flavobacterium sp.]